MDYRLTVRPATEHESRILLDGHDGFVAELGGGIVGCVGYDAFNADTIYVHSLAVMGGPPHTMAALHKAIEARVKELNFSAYVFHVRAPYLSLLRLAFKKGWRCNAMIRKEVH